MPNVSPAERSAEAEIRRAGSKFSSAFERATSDERVRVRPDRSVGSALLPALIACPLVGRAGGVKAGERDDEVWVPVGAGR